MATDIDPIIGNWYQYLQKGQIFLVVAIDQESGLIEIQHFDADLEEISFNNWYELNIETSEAPENWSGPLDVVELDDFGTEITETVASDWSEPLDAYNKSDSEKLTPDPENSADVEDENFLDEELVILEKEL